MPETFDRYNSERDQPPNKVTLTWTSDSSGNATVATSRAIKGVILRVVTNPGDPAPTDDYDLTCTDEDGVDVFAGQGANRDTANAEHFTPGVPLKDGTTTSVVPIAVCGILTLNVSNAGNAKAGSVTIYFR